MKKVTFKEDCKLLIGCHGEFDNITLLTCLNFKKTVNPNIKLSVVLTNVSYLNKDKYGYNKLTFYENNDCETIFYDIEDVHYKKRIAFSNKQMVDNSDLIICYVDNNAYKSGAKTAINYAKKQNKKIINLFDEKDKI